jgi:hypothetical protein
MSRIEQEDGAVDRDLLPEKFPELPKEDLFKLIDQLQLKGALLEPFPHFYRVMYPQTDPSKWEIKIPTSAASKKKGPYEFTQTVDQDIAQKIRSSGTYHIELDGYVYWLQQGGLSRRKIKDSEGKPTIRYEASVDHTEAQGGPLLSPSKP